MEQGCYGCHQIGNVGTPLGSNPSHIGPRYGYAQLAAWLRDRPGRSRTPTCPRSA